MAIRHVLLDPISSRARARAARHKVERELSFQQRMQRVEEVYDSLMARFRQVRVGRPPHIEAFHD